VREREEARFYIGNLSQFAHKVLEIHAQKLYIRRLIAGGNPFVASMGEAWKARKSTAFIGPLDLNGLRALGRSVPLWWTPGFRPWSESPFGLAESKQGRSCGYESMATDEKESKRFAGVTILRRRDSGGSSVVIDQGVTFRPRRRFTLLRKSLEDLLGD